MRRFVLYCMCLMFTFKIFGLQVQTQIIKFPQNGKLIEVFVAVPSIENAPLLFILHGVKTDMGVRSIPEEFIQHWIVKGYVVAGISLPGFGKTEGERDFGGTWTMQALNFAIDQIKAEQKKDTFAILGLGQGGMCGLMLAAERKDVRCVVSANVVYDLLARMSLEDALMKVIVAKYAFNHTEDEFRKRSPMEFFHKICAAIFVIHREEHHYLSTSEVLRFVEAFREMGGKCNCSLLPKIPGEEANVYYHEIIGEAGKWVDCFMTDESNEHNDQNPGVPSLAVSA